MLLLNDKRGAPTSSIALLSMYSLCCVVLSKPVGFSKWEVPGPWDAVLSREHGLYVPGHDAVQEGIKVHEYEAGGEVVVIFFHGARKKVVPLYTHPLLFKQSEILTTKAKRHRRQQALQKPKMYNQT